MKIAMPCVYTDAKDDKSSKFSGKHCVVKISFNILEFQKMYLQEINSIFRYFCILISLKGRFIKNLLHTKI